ncbi:MAG: FKBP-type peptidyl-prolyl cis-trans isomerase, partial [Candidatus Woesearchaeota archaeon]
MLKKNDFVEIEYTGKTKEDGFIFDTTDEKTAKENGIHNQKATYGAVPVCIGQGQILPGLDDIIQGKEVGKEFTAEIPAEKAFGKKDPKMIQLIATSKFKKANINPTPGMQVNIDNQMGIIKTVSGGRTLVDFNHPLSGKDMVYTVKPTKIIEDNVRKVQLLVSVMLQIDEPKVTIEGEKAIVSLQFDMPEQVTEVINKKILEIVPAVKEITYNNTKNPAKAQPQKEKAEE